VKDHERARWPWMTASSVSKKIKGGCTAKKVKAARELNIIREGIHWKRGPKGSSTSHLCYYDVLALSKCWEQVSHLLNAYARGEPLAGRDYSVPAIPEDRRPIGDSGLEQFDISKLSERDIEFLQGVRKKVGGKFVPEGEQVKPDDG